MSKQNSANSSKYTAPVDALLNQGDARESMRHWPDYRALGLTEDHVPELLAISLDDELAGRQDDSGWAPIHARRALGQLQAVETLETLFHFLTLQENEDDDWLFEELPRVAALCGEASIPHLSSFLANSENPMHARVAAAEGLAKLGEETRSLRMPCAKHIERVLEQFSTQDEDFNGFLISNLLKLDYSDALPLIERAYREDRVEIDIVGDFNDVRAHFGLPPVSDNFFADIAFGTVPQRHSKPNYSRFLQTPNDVDVPSFFDE
jgi:hypothetical protein